MYMAMTAVDIRGARWELQSGTAAVRKKGGKGHDQNSHPAHTRKTKSGEIKILYCFISENFIIHYLLSTKFHCMFNRYYFSTWKPV